MKETSSQPDSLRRVYMSRAQLAEHFNVTNRAISKIIKRKKWRRLKNMGATRSLVSSRRISPTKATGPQIRPGLARGQRRRPRQGRPRVSANRAPSQ